MSGKLPRGPSKDTSDYRPLSPGTVDSLTRLPAAFERFAEDVRNSFGLLTNKFLPMLEHHDQRIEAGEHYTRENTERIRLLEVEHRRDTDRIAALEKFILDKDK